MTAPRGVLWRGLPGKSELSAGQLSQLKAAGVSELIFNLNDAGARGRWKWDGPRLKIIKRIEAAAAAGFTIGLMPWVWCSPRFMRLCGKKSVELMSDLEGIPVRLLQLDWEGSAEVSAKNGSKRAGVSLEKWVDQSLTALCEELEDPSIKLGLTTLYFRRPAGDCAIKWYSEINGVHRSLEEWIGQFYSSWLTSPPHSQKKARSTQKANFQPGILQERGDQFYSSLYKWMSSRGAGVNLWALKRPTMTAARALDLAVEEVRSQNHNVFAGWAGHLIARNAARFDLALRAFDRVTNNGARVNTRLVEPKQIAALACGVWGEPPPGAWVRWDDIKIIESVAQGGRPPGWSPIKTVGLTAGQLGPLAKYVRGEMIRNGCARGTAVEVVLFSKKLICVLQKHTATYRGGRLVTGLDLDGLTIFAQR